MLSPSAAPAPPSVRVATVIGPPRWGIRRALAAVAQLWDHRDLIAVLSRHRIHVRYKQSILGGLWAVLQPLAMMAVFTVVFSRLVRVPSDGAPYALFAYAGILPWTFFSSAVSAGTVSLVSHGTLITKVYFPREILPLTYVVAAAIDLVIGATGLLLLVFWFNLSLGWPTLWIVPIVLVLGAFALACALVLAAVQVHVRDIGVALPVALQLWMFASPVLYPVSVVPEAWRPWFMLNPIAGLIDGFRRAVLGQPVDAQAVAVAALTTAIALPVTYMFFKRLEATVADAI